MKMLDAWQNDVKRSLFTFKKAKLSIAGLVFILFLIFIALFGASIVPFPEDAEGALHISDRHSDPSAEHLFGTDYMGRDIYSRVIIGTRVALQTPVIVLSIAGLIGLSLGAIAGFVSGVVDEVIMRVTDIFMTIPDLVLAIAVTALLGPGIKNAFLALSLVWWPGYCRLMRGQVMAIREEDYVTASKAMGAKPGWIILRHILPNTLTQILVKVSLDVGFVILSAAALGFIGLGAQPPFPEWGAMVSEAKRSFPLYWWSFIFPGSAIFLTVLAFNLLGDGIANLAGARESRLP
jgi:peptide/nickel transport system permease protein